MGRKSNAQKERERLEALAVQGEPEFQQSEASEPAGFQDTPEFRAAVAEGIKQALPTLKDQIIKSLSQAREGGGEKVEGDDMAWAKALAMEISQLTDQGTGRKRVAPEIVRQRALARDRMMNALIEARAKGETPSYRLANKVYLDEVLVDPVWVNPTTKSPEPVEIDWPGVPSTVMIPSNDVARKIHAAFMESVGGVERVVPEDRFGITPGGLVVKNNAAGGKRSLPPSLGAIKQHSDSQEGLRIKHRGEPGQYVEKHILGTVAAPARQTA